MIDKDKLLEALRYSNRWNTPCPEWVFMKIEAMEDVEPDELGYTFNRIISAYKALVKRQRFELAAVGTQLEAKDRELLPFEEGE